MRIRDLFKNKYFLIFLVIITCIILAALYIDSRGPALGAGTVTLPGGAKFNPRPYTDALHSTIYSYAFGFSDSKPYQDLLNLSDAEFAEVAKDWNTRYYKEDNETLRAAIYGEYLATTLQNQIQDRFKSLNIS